MSYKNARLFAAGPLFLFACVALAQKTAADIPVETFFKRAQYQNMRISPNGKRLAAAIPAKGRDNLVVIDLEKRTRSIITGFTKFDVVNVNWINNDRLCFRAADGQDVSGSFNYLGTFCVDHDGNNIKDFTRVGTTRASGMDSSGGYTDIQFLRLTHDGSPDVIVGMNLRSRDSLDVYRFNTMNGKAQLLNVDSPGYVTRWVLDRANVPRVAVTQPRLEREGRTREVWYRDNADAKWERLAATQMVGSMAKDDVFDPVAFDYDNTTLYVSTNRGRDKQAIYKFDTKARKLGDLVFEDPVVDVDGRLIFSETQKKLMGIFYESGKPTMKWLDADLAKLQQMLDATFPKTFNFISLPAETDKVALITSESDVQPAQYNLLDRTKPSVEYLAQTREWIEPNLMSERRFITYKARDGLEIPAWITIPKGSSGKNLPLIVNIHGGPNVRGYQAYEWGRWPEAQFFASRGYLVLEPEPRGSTGYGRKHYTVAWKQWGQAMQDDITDGALHLVKEGLADRNRMCLHGGSYGGYASAMGLVKDPDLWKCGSPFVAVTDLFKLQSISYSDIAQQSDYLDYSFKELVGDPKADEEMLRKYSPALQAGRIKAPVLLAMGSDDVRVPIVHGTDLRDAIQRAGGRVEFVVYNGEGHGFNKDENVVDFYRRLEAFFAANLKK